MPNISLYPSKSAPRAYRVQDKSLNVSIYFNFKKYGSQVNALKAAEAEVESLNKRIAYRQMREDLSINKLFNEDGSLKGFKMIPENGIVKLSSKIKVQGKLKQINRKLKDGDCFRDVFQEIKNFMIDNLDVSVDHDIKCMFAKVQRSYQKSYENEIYIMKIKG